MRRGPARPLTTNENGKSGNNISEFTNEVFVINFLPYSSIGETGIRKARQDYALVNIFWIEVIA
jgi:hypothetical protein